MGVQQRSPQCATRRPSPVPRFCLCATPLVPGHTHTHFAVQAMARSTASNATQPAPAWPHPRRACYGATAQSFGSYEWGRQHLRRTTVARDKGHRGSRQTQRIVTAPTQWGNHRLSCLCASQRCPIAAHYDKCSEPNSDWHTHAHVHIPEGACGEGRCLNSIQVCGRREVPRILKYVQAIPLHCNRHKLGLYSLAG